MRLCKDPIHLEEQRADHPPKRLLAGGQPRVVHHSLRPQPMHDEAGQVRIVLTKYSTGWYMAGEQELGICPP